MNLVKRIKTFFYNLSLRRAIKNIAGTKREMINIEAAKNIGILYNASKVNDVLSISKFEEQLKAQCKTVFKLGYQNQGGKEDPGVGIVNKNNINLFGIASDPKVDRFQSKKTDILICAFNDECLPLEYIAATSKAKFRVGAFNQSKTNYYELMINTGANQDLSYLLQQVLHFLKVINKK